MTVPLMDSTYSRADTNNWFPSFIAFRFQIGTTDIGHSCFVLGWFYGQPTCATRQREAVVHVVRLDYFWPNGTQMASRLKVLSTHRTGWEPSKDLVSNLVAR